jgi:phage tail-like protein
MAATTTTRRKPSKLIAAETSRSTGTLHELVAAAPVAVVVDDSEPTAAAMMAGLGSISGKAKATVKAGPVTASVEVSIGKSSPLGGSLGGGAKGGSSPRDGDPDVSYAFKVIINSVTYAMFSEIGGLSWKAEAIPVRSGGNNEHGYNMRGPGKFEPLTLKRGWFASNGEFYDMMKSSLSGSSKGSGAGAARSNITITVLNRSYQPIGEYQIFNAFITEYSGLALNAMSSQVAFEQIRMVYDYFVYNPL